MAKLLERRKAERHFAGLPGGSIEHCTVGSDALGVHKEFSVYLPAGYEEGGGPCPVLYLLHPAGGIHESWIRLGQLPQVADTAIRSGMAAPMIIVLPDASGMGERHLGKRLGFFSVPGWDYEAFFHEELLPLIDAEYRTCADRRHRAIAGASMGGEAAVAYAQKHPDLYGAACALSGLVGKPEQSRMAETDKDYAASLIANDPTTFVKNADQETVGKLKTLRWYADCGDNDFFYEGNVAFFLAMKARDIPLSYRMRSGAHDWYYWSSGLAPVLQFVSVAFAQER